jgi:hypothetical protein
MLNVGDIVDIAKVTALNNLVVAKNEDTIIKFISMGVSELYRRFNLSIKTETIITNPMLNLYELRNKDVSLILAVYNSRGEELKQSDVIEGFYDYKIVNYRSFLLREARDDMMFAVYKASPDKVIDRDDVIDLPDSMMNALLLYVYYLAHSTINKDNVNEANVYSQRFEIACRDLENQGYKIPITTESIGMIVKGYR